MADSAFFIMFGAAAVYAILGNYLYFSKVLPAIDQPPKFLPGGQMSQVDQYLATLAERDERQWFEPLLRNARHIGVIYIIGFAITGALIIIES